MNADDLLYPGAIKAVVGAFALNPGAGVVYGSSAKIDILGDSVKDISFRPFNALLLRQLFYISQPSMYFRRNEILQVLGLEEKKHFAMDWELVLKLLDKIWSASGRNIFKSQKIPLNHSVMIAIHYSFLCA